MGLALALVLAILLVAAPAQAAPPASSGRLMVGFKKGVSTDRQQQLLAGSTGASRSASSRSAAAAWWSCARAPAVRPTPCASASPAPPRWPTPSPTSSCSNRPTRPPTTPSTPPVRAGRLARRPRHRCPEAWGTRTGCAKVAVLDTGIDTDHPDLEEQPLQEQGQAEQRQGRRQERLRRRHLRLNVIKGKGSGEDNEGHGTHVGGSSPRTGTTTRASPASAGRRSCSREVHELDGQGLDLRRDRGHRVRGQAGHQGHQLLVRLEVEVVRTPRRGQLRAEPQHPARGRRRQQRPEHRQAPALPGLVQRLEHPRRGRVHATTSSPLLELRLDAVDVAAPGDNIFSTYLGGGYRMLSGTSMAAPYAAGVAAMLRKQQSDATYGNLRTRSARRSTSRPR